MVFARERSPARFATAAEAWGDHRRVDVRGKQGLENRRESISGRTISSRAILLKGLATQPSFAPPETPLMTEEPRAKRPEHLQPSRLLG